MLWSILEKWLSQKAVEPIHVPPETAFIALDVETANDRKTSICQIGLAFFSPTECLGTWSSLVDPDDYFDDENIAIHGITPESVSGSPSFKTLYYTIAPALNGKTIVSFTGFDKKCMTITAQRNGLPELECEWRDAFLQSRWALRDLPDHRLVTVARRLGIEQHHHHDAADDARVAGLVYLACLQITEEEKSAKKTAQVPTTGLPLSGQIVVFTGELSISRSKAIELAATAGAVVKNSVTRQTTILVEGEQDIELSKDGVSDKQVKAHRFIEEGLPISIIGESEFMTLVAQNQLEKT